MNQIQKRDKNTREGWQAEKDCRQKVYHYIVGTFSLCNRLGFYTGELTPHKKGQKGKEDCSECFRRVEKRTEEVKSNESDSETKS